MGEGGTTYYWVEYGPGLDYPHQSLIRNQSIPAQTAAPVSVPIAGLSPQTLYHYRICAQDQQEETGTRCSPDATFTTKPAGGRSGIAFFSTRGPGSPFTRLDVIAMDSGGANQANLTNASDSSDAYPAWSPDGRRIAYTRTFYENGTHLVGTSQVWVMNADGSGKAFVADNAFEPAWSPDGKRIAFTRYANEAGDVWVMDADGTHQQNLTEGRPLTQDQPAWSPDGSRIAFRTPVYPEDVGELYVMNADGSNKTRLTNNGFSEADPAWSPDGRQIAFTRKLGAPFGFEIFAMAPDGSNEVNLTKSAADEYEPTWRPDGLAIAFDEPSFDIFSLSLGGSATAVNVTNNPAEDYFPAWSPRRP